MKTSFVTVFLFTAVIFEINADPFVFFPQHLLPPIGTTFNFTFDGSLSTIHVSGVYSIQAVTGPDMKTIIGYRNWQSYSGGYSAIFYGVSYLNGTYLQALVDPNTQECINVFSEIMDCTNWLNTGIVNWDSRCSFVRVDSPISGAMTLTIVVSTSDLMRPANFSGTTTMTGSPDKVTIAYQFLSKTVEKNFPYIKCYF
ncbi:unnamed protein product [Rotaria socialis]|uniref:Uncharacterized protein n=1 Tax=Rotaria socialis TaxID=392032 RepID=A0A818ELB6_9BILA|nr:unnamed protein product [Rotaria socialis]CAF4804087.1 unnamed protein product [Rotaria socialis]